MYLSFWHKVPIVRMLIPFTCGIGMSMFYTLPVSFLLAALLTSLITYLIAFYTIRSYASRWVHGIILNLFMLCFGWLLHDIRDERREEYYFNRVEHKQWMWLRITEPPIFRSKTVKLKTEVKAVTDSLGSMHQASGRILVYIKNKELTKTPAYGDIILIHAGSVREIMQPQNPDEFNYKRYLAFNQIYYQAYIQPHQFIQSGYTDVNELFRFIYSLQAYFKITLSRYIGSPGETGVAQALMYGYDDDIDAETMQAYSNTGTLHVLAVSGMHVGIIFMIMGWMLGFMEKDKKLKLLKQMIIILFLWAYSFLCGLSPSILRATVMFSIIIISDMLTRKTNVYNTLASSAFILLLADCNMLANVGFQLSYAAVLGIIFIHPLIYEWISPRLWINNEIWKITSVSIAAQISTSPIGILYFHQFPNCFLFSNLLIIPLTTLVLYVGLILLMLSKFGAIASFLGQVMYWLIAFTNATVKFVESIPYAYVNGIHISIGQSILLYLIIGTLIFYFLSRYIELLQTAIICSIIFLGIQFARYTENKLQQRILLYSVSNHFGIQLFNGNKGLLLIDSALWADKEKVKFHMQQHWWKSDLSHQNIVFTESGWQMIHFNNNRILISSKEPMKPDTVSGTDYIIWRFAPNAAMLTSLNCREHWVSSSVSRKKQDKLKNILSTLGLSAKFVSDSGAIQLSLQSHE